jgi:hypothetical protein
VGRDAPGQTLLSIDSLAARNAEVGALPFEDRLFMERLHSDRWEETTDLRNASVRLPPDQTPLDPMAFEGLRMWAALEREREAPEDRFVLALADAMPHQRDPVAAIARSPAAHSRLRGGHLDGLRPPVLRSISSRAVMTRDERPAHEPILAAARWDAIGLQSLLTGDAGAEAAAALTRSIEKERAIVEQARRAIPVCAPELVADMVPSP